MSCVVVIGVGVVGFVMVGLFVKEGYDVVVLEKNDCVGGCVGMIECDGFWFDFGLLWYLMFEVFDYFFVMMGILIVEQFDFVCFDFGYWVFCFFDFLDVVDGLVMVLVGWDVVICFFEILEFGLMGVFDVYFDFVQYVGMMVQRYFFYNFFIWLCFFVVLDVLCVLLWLVVLLGMCLQVFVVWCFWYLVICQIFGYFVVFFGMDLCSVLVMYYLMSVFDFDQGVSYLQGGFWCVVEWIEGFVCEVGVWIVMGVDVIGICIQDIGGVFYVIGVGWWDEVGYIYVESVDIVVFVVDLYYIEIVLLFCLLQFYFELWWVWWISGFGGVLVMLGVCGIFFQFLYYLLFFMDDWDVNFDVIFGLLFLVFVLVLIYVC